MPHSTPWERRWPNCAAGSRTRTGASSTVNGRIPPDFVQALEAGYLGALIPEQYGGRGLGLTAAQRDPRNGHSLRRSLCGVPRIEVHDGRAVASRKRRTEAAIPPGRSRRHPSTAGLLDHRGGVRFRHDLRHTAASLAISASANVKAVQRMLGHASAAMTLDTYADLFEDDLDDVSARLDDAIENSYREFVGIQIR